MLEAGPDSAPLALCLHGFPDTAWTWRYLLPALAAAGFHALAPFMRGYAPTSIPADANYQTATLAMDANAIHDSLAAGDDAVIVGHDWGALAAYGAVAIEPDRWRRAITIAVPPPGAMLPGFLTYDQLRLSWYMFFFQSPLAELAVGANDLSFLARLWADWSPGYDATEDLSHVRESLGSPANLQAAISYYRAQFDPAHQNQDLAPLQAAAASTCPKPTLYLHGSDDGCIGQEVGANALEHLVGGSRRVVVGGAGHFLHLESPAQINDMMIGFLSED